MSSKSTIPTFQDGDIVELNRSPEAGNMLCKIKSVNGELRELCFQPGVPYTVSDEVDAELCMNKTTKDINTKFVNGFQTEPKGQFKLVED